MHNPWSKLATPEKKNPWAKGKVKLPVRKSPTTVNGTAVDITEQKQLPSGKPSLAGLKKPKPAPGGKLSQLAKKKEKPLPKKQNARDFYEGGVLFWNAAVTGDTGVGYRNGVRRPIGTVDVSNGDKTYTLHNRYGSWMHDIEQGEGMMAEPARVAIWLGLKMNQVTMAMLLTRRFEAELKQDGIKTVHQQRADIERAEAEARKRTKKPTAKELEKAVDAVIKTVAVPITKPKSSGKLSGIKKDKKANPWSRSK